MSNEKNNHSQLTPITSERAKELGAKGGRAKKGSIHLSTRIQTMLEDETFEQKLKDGTILKGQPIEAILKVAVAKARTGDIRFLEWLAKYGWGQKIDITSNENSIFTEKELIIKVIDNGDTGVEQEAKDSP